MNRIRYLWIFLSGGAVTQHCSTQGEVIKLSPQRILILHYFIGRTLLRTKRHNSTRSSFSWTFLPTTCLHSGGPVRIFHWIVTTFIILTVTILGQRHVMKKSWPV